MALKEKILTINGGSSSIRFAVFDAAEPHKRNLSGKLQRIGMENTRLTFSQIPEGNKETVEVKTSDYNAAIAWLLDWLTNQSELAAVKAVGHRIVQGMHHSQPERITKELLDDLYKISGYDPDHLPGEISLIEGFLQRHPQVPQFACFDTAFHAGMPRVAKLLPLPRRFDAEGIQHYGFHGISYAYLLERLKQDCGDAEANRRIIMAHLGNGASLAAVHNGKSIDTSMGFTPAGGLPMGSRTGDLDPGVAWYLMQSENLTPQQFNYLINHQSGMLGISETSSDMQDLLKSKQTDIRAAEAIELFCYQVKKWIGAFAAALGGLDTLVFAGGIGENSPVIRERVCQGLDFLGIDIAEKENNINASVISSGQSRVAVRVIATDEEWMIAKTVSGFLNN